MTMLTPNDVPDAPEWECQPRDWDADGCCPADCPRICESAQHALWIHGTDEHIIRGTE